MWLKQPLINLHPIREFDAVLNRGCNFLTSQSLCNTKKQGNGKNWSIA